MSNRVSRRAFLGTTASAAAAFSVIPNHAMGSVLGHRAPSDKLNVAVIGPGGRGRSMLNAVKPTENIVALCDVDWRNNALAAFNDNANARRYKDYRKMYEEMRNSIDAVIVASADHAHACQAAEAIVMGKHVYVEKPLTHSVYESRLLTNLAAKHKVATQMGNQGSSGPGVSQIVDWITAGVIGPVRRVDTFTDRPIWPQGLNTPKQPQWVPDGLDWDLFTGPAKLIPYHEIYHPWNWRGWWAYGTGALGDMACHIMHPIFKALRLGYPTKVQGSSTMLLVDCAPTAQFVKYVFPARNIAPPRGVRMTYPEVEVNWYDGGIKPVMPSVWPAGKNMNDQGGGCIFYGEGGDMIVCGCYGVNPWILRRDGSVQLPEADVAPAQESEGQGQRRGGSRGDEFRNLGATVRPAPATPKTQREIPRGAGGHEMDWVRACKESPDNRTETASYFGEAGPFNEMVVMGVLAVRLQGLNKELHWDGEKMEFTNIGDNEGISMIVEDRFSVADGHPQINPIRSPRMNAKEFARELIKHTYREGWSLPAMPA